MLTLMLNLLVAAIVEPTTMPTAAIAGVPNDRPPSAIVAATLASERNIPCADNLPCWKQRTLHLDLTIQFALDAMVLNEARTLMTNKELAVWKKKVDDTTEAIKTLSSLPSDGCDVIVPAWYQSPILWFAVGFVAASATSIGIYAAAKRL